MLDLDGILPAVVTPMDDDSEIDEKQLLKYIEWLKGFKGLKGLAVNMDTGEGPHLTDDERAILLKTYSREAGRDFLILAGIAGRSTREARQQAQMAKECGADALVVFPPPVFAGAALGPEIPVAYHNAIAEASGLPLILFQLQSALAGAIFQEDTLLALADIEQAVAIKEASFDAVTFVTTCTLLRKAGKDITILTGNDNFIYESLLLGATGALIGFGTIAIQEQIDMHLAAMEGRVQEGRALWEKVRPLEEAIFDIPVRNYRARMKSALKMIGVIDNDTMREPLMAVGDEDREKIRACLDELGMV